MHTNRRSLSANEAKVILELEWRGQRTVTLSELRRSLGASEGYTRSLVHGLIEKGWLERLRPGLYQLVPADRGLEGAADANPLAAGAVLVEPYFFSFGTACNHHGFTDQMFEEVYIACLERRRALTIRGKRYIYVHVPEQRFFGFETTTVLGAAVQMASPERALLDAISRPRYAGGIGEVSGIVARGARRISWKVLLEQLRMWNSSALVQRLGYLLDLNQVEAPADARSGLLRLIRSQSKIQLGSRYRWGAEGKLVRPWNVVENVPRDVLVSKSEKHRHRVVLHRKDDRH